MERDREPKVRITGTRDTGKSLHKGPLPFYVSVEREDPKLYKVVEDNFSFIENETGVKIPKKYTGSGPWKEGEFGSVE